MQARAQAIVQDRYACIRECADEATADMESTLTQLVSMPNVACMHQNNARYLVAG